MLYDTIAYHRRRIGAACMLRKTRRSGEGHHCNGWLAHGGDYDNRPRAVPTFPAG